MDQWGWGRPVGVKSEAGTENNHKGEQRDMGHLFLGVWFGFTLGLGGGGAWGENGDGPGRLSGRAAAAQSPENIPVIVVFEEQLDLGSLPQRPRLGETWRDHAQRVASSLEAFARAHQAALLAELRRWEATSGAAEIRPLWIINAVAARVRPEHMKDLAAWPGVRWVLNDLPRPAFEQSADDARGSSAGTASSECGVERVNAPKVWETFWVTGRGVLTGVADSGSCHEHPDLVDHVWMNPGEIPDNGQDDDRNGYVDDVIGWNFEESNNRPVDTLGHGTHVAGIVAGDGTEGTETGVAPDAAFVVQRIGSDRGIAFAPVWESMQYSVENGIRVQNMSFTLFTLFPDERAAWRMVAENTMAAGVVLVAAAGNAGNCCPPISVGTPADIPGVIAVGATDCSDVVTWFSSQGPVQWANVPGYGDFPYPPGLTKPDVTAPGIDLLSADFAACKGYVKKSGTSMATPHVAGIVSLMLEANPYLSPSEVRDILESTALDLGAAGKDNVYGAGRVDAFGAVQMARKSGSACERIDEFIARCKPSGKGAAILRLKDSALNGALIVIRLNGVEHETRIRGSRAKVSDCCFTDGVKAKLVSPRGCSLSATADCP